MSADEKRIGKLPQFPPDWLVAFEATAKPKRGERCTYAFIKAHKPVTDEVATFQMFESVEDYRRWCERLPELEFRRAVKRHGGQQG